MFSRIKKYFSHSSPKAVVLMYHRVIQTETDPWQLAVSPDNFESQINAITKSYTVLPVSHLLQQLNQGAIKHKTVYITFDDAYYDNYLFAKPILEKYSCPATFFIPTYFIGKQELYWWDELETIILHSISLPSNLTLKIDQNVFTFKFEIEQLNKEIKEKQQGWNWPAKPPTNRCRLYLKIWEVLKPLPNNKIFDSINVIRQWANYSPVYSPNDYPMNTEQLKSLAKNMLFSVGSHTFSHAALGYHSKEFQSSEIAISKSYLENNGYPHVSAIAYPYGSYNDDTISLMKQNEIALGFTTSGEVITRSSSQLCLGRLQTSNCSGATLIKRLKHYFD